MLLMGLMFSLTPPTIIWLLVHLVRFRTRKPLPDGLIVLLIIVAGCWIIAISVLIGNLDRPYG
jgi:hypothetical protein